MASLILSFPLLFCLVSSLCVSATLFHFHIPRHRERRRTIQNEPKTTSASESNDFQTFFYTQTLDHFNYKPESYSTFRQRYMINFKYWGGANTTAPIFAWFGGEESIDYDMEINGFLPENAPRFKALMVYIEHRYYGKSIPFGSLEEAMKDASTLGYLNSAQSMADYAAVLLHIIKTYSARKSPVIVVGGSYGGMLAAWFRLKYPHIALGALASSAPILYFDGIAPQVGYYTIITKDFKETSESCYETIRKSWAEIDEVASRPNGLSILGKKFRTCKPLNRTFELKDYLDSMYAGAAQYNEPPIYPLSGLCSAIDGVPEETDTLGKIFAGVVAYMQNRSCYDMYEFGNPTQTYDRFTWQVCTELVFPIGHGPNDTMFPTDPFDLNNFTRTCEGLFGVKPKPHWVTTYYGGQDLKLILHRFASNIIFSNGGRDPYSSGGVLKNVSDSIVALCTVYGSHCLDMLPSKQSDPEWLVSQRKAEVEIIEGWIEKYQIDLSEFENENYASH